MTGLVWPQKQRAYKPLGHLQASRTAGMFLVHILIASICLLHDSQLQTAFNFSILPLKAEEGEGEYE